jgi:hypothetical protein
MRTNFTVLRCETLLSQKLAAVVQAASKALIPGEQMTNQNSTEETVQEYYDRLSSKWDSLASRTTLDNVYKRIQEMDSEFDSLAEQIDALRTQGYIYHGSWEVSIEEAQNRWPKERRNAEQEYNRVARSLQNDAREIERQFHSAGRSRSQLSRVESDINSFELRVQGAEQRVQATFSRTDSQLGEIYEKVEWAEFLMENLRDASFKLYPSENGVAAAKAEWVSNKKEGLLYLTNQRIIFEQHEEKATKKVLFITTEKELVRELMWEAPIGAVEEVEAKDKGGLLGFGVKELLTLKFNQKAKDVPKETQLRFRDYADNEWWEKLIDLVKTGQIENQKFAKKGRKDRSIQHPKVSTSAPTICPSCSGKLPMAFKGMQQLECEFCGNVVNLALG